MDKGKNERLAHPDFGREGPKFESWYPDLKIKRLDVKILTAFFIAQVMRKRNRLKLSLKTIATSVSQCYQTISVNFILRLSLTPRPSFLRIRTL
ncbi:MAG: hypothetical protein JWO03_3951 [Bacteroidetes bacterium]|nr:hypothetical protein [Bacteroidota bacterium]